MPQLHLSDQQSNCLLKCVLYRDLTVSSLIREIVYDSSSVANGCHLCGKNTFTKRWPRWCLCLVGVTLLPGPGSPDSKVHGAIMEPIWGRQDPGGPHVGPMNFTIWQCMDMKIQPSTWSLYWQISSHFMTHIVSKMRSNLVRCWNNVAHIWSTLLGVHKNIMVKSRQF